ncbi:recombinase family protein [Acidisphaera sp. S103]|uniref:recombinase family protein n=1 Tax=Acidisphaera sp. S103 TaxID=1747223 RepID=UPI00131D73C0|nr:recombinase family protein [Acidisphaera sp. S103]
MIYGYARVSTDVQGLFNQVAQFQAAGCKAPFCQKISVAMADQPRRKTQVAKLAAGDVVAVPEVDSVSCDTIDHLVNALDMQRVGARLRLLSARLFQ